MVYVHGKAQDFLLIQKFVRRMKGSKRKIVYGQIFKKAENLWAYSERKENCYASLEVGSKSPPPPQPPNLWPL